MNRVTEETNELLASRYFAYGAIGNLVKRIDRNGRTIEYGYDDLYRRTEERWLDSINSVIRTFSYSYDAAGQLTEAAGPAAEYSYTFNALGRATAITHDLAALIAVISFDQAYDGAGNRAKLATTIGASDDFETNFTYDALHRMTRIEQRRQCRGR